MSEKANREDCDVMKLIIGNKNYSSWSLRAYMALSATGAEYEEIVIPLDTPQTHDEIRRYSQAGRVPVLVDGTVTVWDSLAIIEYLADKFPSARLWSDNAATRAVMRSISAEMHSGFAALRSWYPMNIRKTVTGRAPTPDVQADVDRITAIWREALEDDHSGGPYLFGAFSAVDAMFTPVVSRFETYGVAVGKAERAYMDAVLTNPRFEAWERAARVEPWVIEGEEVA